MKCFVVLEPANHMFKVIEAAAARGMPVIAFHSRALRADGAYRAGLAAITQTCQVDSWDDYDAVFDLVCAQVGPRGIGGTYTSYEALLPLDFMLRQHAGLPVNPPAVLERLLDKRLVRSDLLQAGLTGLAWCDPATVRDGAWPWPGHAAFLKPATGSGSLFVTGCATPDQVAAGLQQWDDKTIAFSPIQRQHLMRSGALFLEQAAEGELMSLEGWVWEGQYHVLGLTSRTVLQRDPSIEMGATFPYAHPRLPAIIDKLTRIHQALGIRHGATHAEIMVGPDGAIELIEMNPRFAGSDVLLLIDMALGVSVGALLADLACGRRPGAVSSGRQRYASVQQLLAPAGSGAFDALALDADLVSEIHLSKPLGSALASTDYQHDQVAAFLVCADSYDAVLDLARQVRAGAQVNGAPLGADRNNVVDLR